MRIALLSNSQGTAAGVEPGEHYPALVRDALSEEHELHLLVVSGWSLRDFIAHAGTVTDIRPDLVIVQIGIVESARRILSRAEKRLLRPLGRPGRAFTRVLHGHRKAVIRARRRLRIDARMYSPEAFDRDLGDLVSALRSSGADVMLLEIPQFTPTYERDHYPHIREDVALFNDVLHRHGAVPFFDGDVDDALWQPGTVHLTPEGHRLAAARIVELVRERAPAEAARS